jgi:sporulation protein YlmC with PRC-barrel domain
MKLSGDVDLALGILDHQLLDRDDRRCGKVDDLELDGVAGGTPRVTAIVSGPGGWRGRGALGRLCAGLARGRTVRIPWEEVDEVGSHVHLRSAASALRLGRGDERARPWIEKLPGASL